MVENPGIRKRLALGEVERTLIWKIAVRVNQQTEKVTKVWTKLFSRVSVKELTSFHPLELREEDFGIPPLQCLAELRGSREGL